MESGTGKFDITKIVGILKTITIDKWLLMGAAGVVLILCSDGCQGSATNNQEDGSGYEENIENYQTQLPDVSQGEDDYVNALEDRLEDILTSVEGAGNVKVMITLKNSSTKEVLKEEPYTEKLVKEEDGDGGSRDTSEKSQDYNVIYESDSDGNSVPFIISETSPKVEGVAVLAQGGDSVVVKEKITSIIKALFDIEINKIAVGKMK